MMHTIAVATALVSLLILSACAPTTPPQPPSLENAATAYLKALKQDGRIPHAKDAYDKAVSSAIANASKVEIYLLDFEPGNLATEKPDPAWATSLPADQFPIIPYKMASTILQRKQLTQDEITLLIPVLQSAIVNTRGGGALCHFPAHGIRIWDGGQLIFQTSICYTCENFYLTYPDPADEADWAGLVDSSLQKVMEKLLPIPASEIERFDVKYRGKKTRSP